MSIPNWELPEKLKLPHPETTEDGITHQHLGYEIRKCVKCRCMFIAAVVSPFNICGRKTCEEVKT